MYLYCSDYFYQQRASYTDYLVMRHCFKHQERKLDESRALLSSIIKRDTVMGFSVHRKHWGIMYKNSIKTP